MIVLNAGLLMDYAYTDLETWPRLHSSRDVSHICFMYERCRRSKERFIMEAYEDVAARGPYYIEEGVRELLSLTSTSSFAIGSAEITQPSSILIQEASQLLQRDSSFCKCFHEHNGSDVRDKHSAQLTSLMLRFEAAWPHASCYKRRLLDATFVFEALWSSSLL